MKSKAYTKRVEVVLLGISLIRSKWASCSTNGHLNFSTELLTQPTKMIVHEQLDLRVPNHGKLWKSLMRGYLGEWGGGAGRSCHLSFMPRSNRFEPMKDRLLELYKRKLPALKAVVAAHPGDSMAGPHLISPNALYSKQRLRLLIIGQETGKWDSHLEDPVRQMAVYEEFNVGINYIPTPFGNHA